MFLNKKLEDTILFIMVVETCLGQTKKNIQNCVKFKWKHSLKDNLNLNILATFFQEPFKACLP